jgi:hypothetical protein
MNTTHIKRSKGWFVLKFDEIYNAQHLCARVTYKIPVECWVYEADAEEIGTPFGYDCSTLEGSHSACICDGDSEPLVELAYDAVVSPDGIVSWPFGRPWTAGQEWTEIFCSKDSGVIIERLEQPTDEAKSRVRNCTLAAPSF